MLALCHLMKPCFFCFFFIVHTVWSRIIVMHWKQESMTGTDRQGDTSYCRYWRSCCHLSHSEQDKPTLSFWSMFFSSRCLSHLYPCPSLSIFLSLSFYFLPHFFLFIITHTFSLHLSLSFSALHSIHFSLLSLYAPPTDMVAFMPAIMWNIVVSTVVKYLLNLGTYS